MTGLPLALAVLCASAVTVDKDAHSVTFTAVSTDPGLDTPIEFLFVGPKSDHDYEALFTTEADIPELVAAFREAGIPVGSPVDPGVCRLWAIGSELEFKPDIWSVIRDSRNERKRAPVYTGGTRTAEGTAVAATNMPCAVFALYNLPQSLIQFDDTLDQSATYGRFLPAVKIAKGEKRTFTVTGTGATNGGKHELTPDFPPEMTVGEAAKRAAILARLDSPETKVNGFKPGQFFYRAFLPLEQWRDRKERLSQPLEVYLGATNKVVVVKEDWSGEGLDPKLIPTELPLAEAKGLKDVTACLIFAAKTTKLADVYAVVRDLPDTIRNWYVYGD